MTEHSPGPWEAAGAWIYADGVSEDICHFRTLTLDQNKANAARAVECVNALAGVPSEMMSAVAEVFREAVVQGQAEESK